MSLVASFREVWVADFEFSAPSGENPKPVCLVAWEINSGKKLMLWQDELACLDAPPYPAGSDSVFVAYYASAEFGCHLSLGWPLPANIIDLYAEFRNATNGLALPCGKGLLGALAWYGLGGIEAAEKESMRDLVLRGGPWTNEEKSSLLEYCWSDVESTGRLLQRMAPSLDIPRALLRGRYMKAVALMERYGVPIDVPTWEQLVERWTEIQDRLIEKIDTEYGVYEGRSFKQDRFASWLIRNEIPWPRLDTGRLDLSDDTFREMARVYPKVAPLRELRTTLSQMRLSDLAVGKDGRNRCLLSPFRSLTARNQPSNTHFIFGPAVWLRGLIRPEPGFGLAYVDWEQQEFGIAAALSRDPRMMEAYTSGDPYLAFAKRAGAVPSDATKESHPVKREQFKQCALGVQYGMGAQSLAERIGGPTALARDLLRLHRETYPRFWKWSDSAIDYTMLHGKLWTTFGWTVHRGVNANPRSLRNFPMQANGAEMLRLACSFATEEGIRICAPVHDALLIEAPLGELDEAIALTQEAMARASALVLGGFPLRSDAKVVRYPDHYMDERGVEMWKTVEKILEELETCSRRDMSMFAAVQVDAHP